MKLIDADALYKAVCCRDYSTEGEPYPHHCLSIVRGLILDAPEIKPYDPELETLYGIYLTVSQRFEEKQR